MVNLYLADGRTLQYRGEELLLVVRKTIDIDDEEFPVLAEVKEARFIKADEWIALTDPLEVVKVEAAANRTEPRAKARARTRPVSRSQERRLKEQEG